MEPDSRRSESIGRLSSRRSTFRESWERATTGQSSSRAIPFKERAMTETLRIEDDGAVRTLVFARPEAANAFNEELYHAAARALRDAASDDAVSVVLLTGEGRAFTAGTDIKEMAEIARDHAAGRSDQEMGGGFIALVDALAEFPKPLMAAVNGSGVGLGITMLGHCDVVLIAEQLRTARTAFDRTTGRAGVEDVLDALFSRFCLGK